MRSHPLSRLTRVALLPLASAAFVLGAQAQGSSNDAGQRASKPDAKASASAPRNAYRAVRASQFIGMEVKNEKGEKLGEIGDLVVDMNTGDLRYAILQFDPGLFSAEQLFAVQTKELKMGQDRNHVVYRMSKERLEKASINRSEWTPRFFDDAERTARLDRASGIKQPSAGARAHRVSDLIGRDIKSRAGEDIGEIEDVVVNLDQQKVQYAVMHFDVGWTTPDKRVVFPLRSFNVAQGKDDLVLDVDKSTIRSMKDFTKDNYASLDNPAFQVDVDRYLVTVVTAANDSRSSSSSMGASGSTSSSSQDQRQAAQGSQGSQASQGQDAQRGSNAGSSSAQSSEAMQKLQKSAQHLRESIQAMAQQEPGEKRDRAIEQAHEALRETNASMIALLPQLHGTRKADSGKPQPSAEYDKSVERLTKASDSLRQSIQAMAKQPAGDARNRAIEQANKALWETQEAMIATYQQHPGRSSSQTMGAGEKQGNGQQKPQQSSK